MLRGNLFFMVTTVFAFANAFLDGFWYSDITTTSVTVRLPELDFYDILDHYEIMIQIVDEHGGSIFDKYYGLETDSVEVTGLDPGNYLVVLIYNPLSSVNNGEPKTFSRKLLIPSAASVWFSDITSSSVTIHWSSVQILDKDEYGVSIKDERGTEMYRETGSKNNHYEFTGIKPGNYKVTVSYKYKGASRHKFPVKELVIPEPANDQADDDQADVWFSDITSSSVLVNWPKVPGFDYRVLMINEADRKKHFSESHKFTGLIPGKYSVKVMYSNNLNHLNFNAKELVIPKPANDQAAVDQEADTAQIHKEILNRKSSETGNSSAKKGIKSLRDLFSLLQLKSKVHK